MIKKDLSYLSKISNQWIFLQTGSSTGSSNMLLDAFLLEEMNKGKISFPVLRTYGWSLPTLSLGVSQTKKQDYKHLGVNVVNRITGGQAVYHDTADSEITYSMVFNSECNAKKIYLEIGTVLISFLGKYNLVADFGYSDKSYNSEFNCFDSKTAADIVVNNTKVIGSAQCRKKNSILQHGSIKLNKIREMGVCVDYKSAESELKKTFEEALNISFLTINQKADKIMSSGEKIAC